MTVSREILANGQLAIETRMLKHNAQSPPHRAGFACQVMTEEPRTASLDRRQCREQLEQSGLSAAVGSEEAENFAASDRKCYIAECFAIAVAKAKRARFDRVRFGANRVSCGL